MFGRLAGGPSIPRPSMYSAETPKAKLGAFPEMHSRDPLCAGALKQTIPRPPRILTARDNIMHSSLCCAELVGIVASQVVTVGTMSSFLEIMPFFLNFFCLFFICILFLFPKPMDMGVAGYRIQCQVGPMR